MPTPSRERYRWYAGFWVIERSDWIEDGGVDERQAMRIFPEARGFSHDAPRPRRGIRSRSSDTARGP